MKYNFINKGYLKTNDKRTGHSDILERVYEINGIDCIELNGKMSSSGAEAWFYEVSNFSIKNNIIEIPEFLPEPKFKIKHSDINFEKYNLSVDIKNETAYNK